MSHVLANAALWATHRYTLRSKESHTQGGVSRLQALLVGTNVIARQSIGVDDEAVAVMHGTSTPGHMSTLPRHASVVMGIIMMMIMIMIMIIKNGLKEANVKNVRQWTAALEASWGQEAGATGGGCRCVGGLDGACFLFCCTLLSLSPSVS